MFVFGGVDILPEFYCRSSPFYQSLFSYSFKEALLYPVDF